MFSRVFSGMFSGITGLFALIMLDRMVSRFAKFSCDICRNISQIASDTYLSTKSICKNLFDKSIGLMLDFSDYLSAKIDGDNSIEMNLIDADPRQTEETTAKETNLTQPRTIELSDADKEFIASLKSPRRNIENINIELRLD